MNSHLNLPFSIKIPVTNMANCLYLHDSCITKFDFMNYAFAKLVFAVDWILQPRKYQLSKSIVREIIFGEIAVM